MKTAIVCDWLVTAGGAERVIQHLLECYPDADLFAVVDFFDDSARQQFLKNKTVITTYIQKFPFAKKLYRNYLPFMPLAIEQLDVSAYDLIISSSHAVAKGVITGPDQIHISYVHSPMRYAWDLQQQYLKESNLTHGFKGYLAKYILHKMRIWDQRTVNNVDCFVANSQFIAKRIWKTYRREAQVIYPPVAIKATDPVKKGDFYLTASRLVPYKKIDLIVDSFANMPNKELVVIGSGPDLKKIQAKCTNNITLLGYQSTEVLIDYMQRAKAFIFAAEEDFGIIPVEAQGYGTPVIAFGKGGCLETINDLSHAKPTGLFFPTQTVEAICQTVLKFEHNAAQFLSENCVQNAQRFSAELFQTEIKQLVNRLTAQGSQCVSV